MEAVRNGGDQGLRLMIDSYGHQVFSMIARQTHDTMDAEELTQDTFLRAFKHFGSYNPKRSSLGTWLSRIAYRLTLNFLKRNHPTIVSIEDSEVWQTDISDEQLSAGLSTGDEDRISRLQQLIDTLPPEEQLLLTLHYFESRPLEECAYIMDSSAHALASRLYRIRKKLYKQLQKQ